MAVKYLLYPRDLRFPVGTLSLRRRRTLRRDISHISGLQLHLRHCTCETGNKFENYILVTLSILPSMYVACPLDAFGGSIRPWLHMDRKKKKRSLQHSDLLASFPGPRPASLHLQYRRGPGTFSHVSDVTGRKTVEKL